MLWMNFAWRNLWRNKRRTLIQLAVISGSMFLAIFYNNYAAGIYDGMVKAGVRSGSGNIGIYHEKYLGDRRLSDTFAIGSILPQLEQNPDVQSVYPRVHVAGLLRSSHNSRPAGAIGLDFAREAENNPILKPEYIAAGKLPSVPNGILIGEGLAKDLKVKVGKKVVWMAQDANGEITSKLFKVSGIIRTNVRAIDAGSVFASREAMAELIGRTGSAHELAIILKNPQDASKVLPKIEEIAATSQNAKAYSWQKAMPDLASLIEIGNSKQKMTVVFLFVVVAIGTLNTMLMSISERTREFGMMRSLGISRWAIRQMIMAEAALLSLVGSAVGFVMAALLGLYTSTKGIDMTVFLRDMDIGGIAADPIIHTGWDWSVTIGLIVGMLVLCIVASLYPARRALKIRPADAMRTY